MQVTIVLIHMALKYYHHTLKLCEAAAFDDDLSRTYLIHLLLFHKQC